MTDNDFFALAKRQRACRDFTDAAVSDSDLGLMLEAATHAPSAHNCQPWEFVIVRAMQTRRSIAEIARSTWDGARPTSQSRLAPRMFADVDQFIHGRDFGGAPTLVVLGVDRSAVHEAMIGCSIYPAAQNLMLGAASLGYGSTFTNFTFAQNSAMSEVLALPDHIQVAGVVALGRPAKRLGPGSRVSFVAKTHVDRFGTRWPDRATSVSDPERP